MATFDIYIGTNNEEATAHGPEYVYDGMNPADALTKMINDMDAMREVRDDHADLTELAAFDDDMQAAIFPCDDGTYELHIYSDDSADTVITIPPAEFVSITDAADMLSISRQRVHVLLQSGQLTGRLIGNAWMVCRASVVSRLK